MAGSSGKFVLSWSHHKWTGWRRSIVVVAEEVGSTTAWVTTTTAELDIQLLVGAIAATIAVKVALTLFIQLSGGVASRHDFDKRPGANSGARWVDVPLAERPSMVLWVRG